MFPLVGLDVFYMSLSKQHTCQYNVLRFVNNNVVLPSQMAFVEILTLISLSETEMLSADEMDEISGLVTLNYSYLSKEFVGRYRQAQSSLLESTSCSV